MIQAAKKNFIIFSPIVICESHSLLVAEPETMVTFEFNS